MPPVCQRPKCTQNKQWMSASRALVPFIRKYETGICMVPIAYFFWGEDSYCLLVLQGKQSWEGLSTYTLYKR